MIDLIALAGLFFEGSKQWTEPKVVKINLNDLENEPAIKKAKADGGIVQGTNEENLHKAKRDGWEPVTEYDKLGRPTIFTDPLGKMIFMRRTKNDPPQS